MAREVHKMSYVERKMQVFDTLRFRNFGPEFMTLASCWFIFNECADRVVRYMDTMEHLAEVKSEYETRIKALLENSQYEEFIEQMEKYMGRSGFEKPKELNKG